MKASVVNVDVRVLSHLKEQLAWAVDEWLRIKNSKSTKELKETKK